ncbi:hypothetical protein EBZ38_03290 [bacterium]|nr:hypothetical protein [bacterium]NDC93986.1 hypothetical protein [bacterium]NDD83291.1 hypothetical protein [bacterium]
MKKFFKGLLGLGFLVLLYKLNELLDTSDLILADPVSIVGGGLGLAKGIFGEAQSQQQQQRSFTQFRPEDLAGIEQARGGLQSGTQGLLGQLQASQEAIRRGITTPTTGFQFGQAPDAMTRALAAQATQGTAQQAAAQQAQIARQFQGQPGAARALQAQAAMQSRLQQNPALFQAYQQQQGRELAQAQQQLAQTQAANQAIMGREQALAGMSGTGMQAQQNLLSSLLGLGQAMGQQVQSGQMQGRSGGLK